MDTGMTNAQPSQDETTWMRADSKGMDAVIQNECGDRYWKTSLSQTGLV
jgi:hypothetical protein